MPYAIRLCYQGTRSIGYQVFNILSNKGVHQYKYAAGGLDEFGVCRALTRALEHANRLNEVLSGPTSTKEALGEGTAQSHAATSADSDRSTSGDDRTNNGGTSRTTDDGNATRTPTDSS